MQQSKASKFHILGLTYGEYLNNGRSIANSRIEKYVVYNELGKGAFGAVYRGMDDQNKKTVAIKVLDLQAVQKQPSQHIRQIQRRLCVSEPNLMMVCDSENVIKCLDVYENRWLKIIVMQYCNGGDLYEEIARRVRIPEKEATLLLKQLINGISELHTHRIIHRDLKAENILSHNGIYKIADFGFSRQVGDDQVRMTTLGTLTTMAPEVLKKEPYGLKADIWSLGVIFFQMIYGKVPYTSTTTLSLCYEIKTKKILDSQQFEYNGYKASKVVTSFLREAMCIDKNKRLGWKDLINHEIFNREVHRLDSEFRLNCQLKQPEILLIDEEAEEKEHFAESFQTCNLQLFVSEVKTEHQLVRLTVQEASEKMKQVRTDEDELYSWAKETHLQCLKTELIYNQIFDPIQKHSLMALQERSVVEFMYLILTRCLNNISVINDRMKHEKPVPILMKLLENVKDLYEKITTAWKQYSLKLTNIENEVGNIIEDRFLKIFKSKSIKAKDSFLTGIQKMEYTKQQQIQYTKKKYIDRLLEKMGFEPRDTASFVKKYLSYYVEINAIKLSEVQLKSFEEHVQMIVQ